MLWPVSSTWTRAAALALMLATLLGLVALCWQRRALRLVLVGILLLPVVFLAP